MTKPQYNSMIQHWQIDQNITFLNHGSFGSTPSPIIDKQNFYKKMLYANPVHFYVRQSEALWWENKALIADFLGANSHELVLIKNATQGVNTILSSIQLPKGSRVLTTNHAYGACSKALIHFAKKNGWEIDTAQIPFPIESEDQVVEAILAAIQKDTKLLMIDHITSATGIIFPIKKIADALKNSGVKILVDGAHAPGMIDLNIHDLAIDYYTGNLHKWCFMPNGAAFLWVKESNQSEIFPLQISHYHDGPLTNEKERWAAQFFWLGTEDNTQWYCFKEADAFVKQHVHGGWSGMREQNRAKLLQGKEILTKALNLPAPAPDNMLGYLFMLPLGIELQKPNAHNFNFFSPLQQRLYHQHGIEMPVYPFICDGKPTWCIRISAQLYNDISQYEYLAEVMKEEIKLL